MRRIRGQRPEPAHPHPARGEDLRPGRAQRRAQPDPGGAGRCLQVPVGTGRQRAQVRRVRRRPRRVRAGCATVRPTAGAASRRRSWTGRTTSPTPCTTSRTLSMPGTCGSTCCADAGGAGRAGRADGATRLAGRATARRLRRPQPSTGCWRLPCWPSSYDGSHRSLAALKNTTSQLIGRFCEAAEDATREAFGDVPLRGYDADLVVPRDARLEVEVLKAVDGPLRDGPRRRDPAVRRAARRRARAGRGADAPARRDGLDPLAREAWEAAADDAGRLRAVARPGGLSSPTRRRSPCTRG